MATNAENTEMTAGTLVEGGEKHEGGAFPPFDSTHFASQLFWLVIVFAALYLLMSRIALPRVADILETRRLKIASDVESASKLQKQAEEAGVAHTKSLADARAKAQALGQAQRDSLSADSDAKRKTLETALNAKISQAEADIAATKSKAMLSVEGIAHETATQIVQQILGRAPNADAISKALKG